MSRRLPPPQAHDAGPGGSGQGTGGARSRGIPGYPVPPELRPEGREPKKHASTFIGLRFPPGIAQKLVIPGGEPAEKLHVTFFYGKGLSPEVEALVVDTFQELFPSTGIPCKLSGLCRFNGSPGSDGKDVLVVTVDSPQLTRLHSLFVTRLEAAGVDGVGDHGYTPHVTVAYLDREDRPDFSRLIDPIETGLLDPTVKLADRSSPDRIDHVDDLDASRLEAFVRRLAAGELEITEKVDGACRLDFRLDEGRVIARTKRSGVMEWSTRWPDRPQFVAARAAHRALEEHVGALHGLGCEEWTSADVLFGPRPNTVRYEGPSRIVVHSRRVPETWLGEGWKLESAAAVRRSFVPPPGPALVLKEWLLKELSGVPSQHGGEMVEGFVFTHRPTGEAVKLVDRALFTELNRFFWRHRELVERGLKEGELWTPGVLGGLRDGLCRFAVGHPTMLAPGFAGKLEALCVREGGVERGIRSYLSEHGLCPDPLKAAAAVHVARERLSAVRVRWDEDRARRPVFEARGRRFELDEHVVARTEAALAEADRRLSEADATLDALAEAGGDIQAAGVFRLALGEAAARRLSSALCERVSADARAISDVVEDNRRLLLKKKDVWVEDPLGAGTQGVAYATSGKRPAECAVLKVTSGRDEAMAMSKVVGKRLKHVVHVGDVFMFKETDHGQFFGILEERLEPLSDKEEAEVTDTHFMFKAIDAFRTAGLGVLDEFAAFLRRKGYDYEMPEVKHAWEVFDRIGFHEMDRELKSFGIDFDDYHGGNVMKRGSGYVVTDLGYSRVAATKEPPLLEAVLAEAGAAARLPALPADEMNVGADVPRFVKLAKQWAPKLAAQKDMLVDPKPLGKGSRGVAFPAHSGKHPNAVLKLTEDTSETRASMKVSGKNLEHVVRVYDVFQLGQTGVYAIFQERLNPLSDEEQEEVTDAAFYFGQIRQFIAGGGQGKTAHDFVSWVAQKFPKLRDTPEGMLRAWNVYFDKLRIDEMDRELKSAGVIFRDYHGGNIMKRGGTYVVIDLGYSEVRGGGEPPVLERRLHEAPVADSVGVTIGRFQPFTKGHGELVRSLAQKHTKVLLLVAGNKKDDESPFSYETRLDVMKRSLPDVLNKVEFHRAEFKGKPSGYVPGILSDIGRSSESSYKSGMAANILVGPDRFESIEKQVVHAAGSGKGPEGFDASTLTVRRLPAVKNPDEADRVSATRAREALVAGDRDAFKKLVDPHLASNESDLEEVWGRLRGELGLQEGARVDEELKDIGGEKGVMSILMANANALKVKKGINVSRLKKLGHGTEGVAFSMGGGRVVKVTADEREAMSSLTLQEKGKSLRHVARIYDVFQLKKTMEYKAPVFVVVQEELRPLSDEEGEEFDEFSFEFIPGRDQDPTREMIPTWYNGTYQQIVDAVRGLIQTRHDLAKKGAVGTKKPERSPAAGAGFLKTQPASAFAQTGLASSPANSSPFQSFSSKSEPTVASPLSPGRDSVETEFKRAQALMKKYQLDKIIPELRSVGIGFADFHAGNLMKRGSDYVIADIGRSRVNGGAKPPVFERRARADEDGSTAALFTRSGTADGRSGSSAWSGGISDDETEADRAAAGLWQRNLGLMRPVDGRDRVKQDALATSSRKTVRPA